MALGVGLIPHLTPTKKLIQSPLLSLTSRGNPCELLVLHLMPHLVSSSAQSSRRRAHPNAPEQGQIHEQNQELANKSPTSTRGRGRRATAKPALDLKFANSMDAALHGERGHSVDVDGDGTPSAPIVNYRQC
eukprot:5535648-Amphidinium_carterae.1